MKFERLRDWKEQLVKKYTKEKDTSWCRLSKVLTIKQAGSKLAPSILPDAQEIIEESSSDSFKSESDVTVNSKKR